MTADPLAWPDFDAPLLQRIVAAFKHRRRAIRYHGQLDCGREFSETPGEASERLNIDAGPNPQLRLSVWADGILWLRACALKPGRNEGWAFLHHFHGTASGVSAEELVQLFEESRLLCSSPGSDCGQALRSLWRSANPNGGA